MNKHPKLYGTQVDDEGRLMLAGYSDENNQTVLTDIKVQYCQGDDQHSDDFQEINIGIDSNGVGFYYYIETKRWAFDDIDDLIALLEDFKKRYTEYERN